MSTASGPDSSAADKRRSVARLDAPAGRRWPARSRDRLGPGTEPAPPPLSFAQQRLWFLDRLVPGSPFYNVPAAIRIRAPIDPRCPAGHIQRDRPSPRRAPDRVRRGGRQAVPADPAARRGAADGGRSDGTCRPAVREREAVRLAEEDARTPFDLRPGAARPDRSACASATPTTCS